MIGRAEDRGLGNMLWEVARHLDPDAVLAVDMGAWARGFLPHRSRYQAATWVDFQGDAPGGPFDEQVVRQWLRGLDLVYTAETFYDPRFPQWCKDEGVRTVLHTMPEFHKPECDLADQVWLPTPWRAEHHPDAIPVPVPVAMDRWEDPATRAAPGHEGNALRVVHVAGHRAAMDRNGTLILCDALRYCRERIHVTIRTQDRDCPHPAGLPGNVTAEVHLMTDDPYWMAPAGHHVLAMPRRYGGLCLPVQEALAAGCAVVMSDVEPNRWWPIVPVAGGRGPAFNAPAGEIATFNTNAEALARELDLLARERGLLAGWQDAARLWAWRYSWERWAPLWRDLLAEVAAA